MNLALQSYLAKGLQRVVEKHTEVIPGQKVTPNLAMVEAMNRDFDVLFAQAQNKFKVPAISWRYRAAMSGPTEMQIRPTVMN